MHSDSHQETRAGPAPGTSTGHDGAKAPHKLAIRTLVAASIGNAVEWYDWTIYVTFSIYFATQIFPAENQSLAFISGLFGRTAKRKRRRRRSTGLHRMCGLRSQRSSSHGRLS